jgi:sterol desaturase/sphingolipid hydroxylase (fatty acid hydroxylase superfamily)
MFTIWDRLFGTLIIEAKETGANFRMGVPTKEGLNPGSPVSLLFGPFRRRSQ